MLTVCVWHDVCLRHCVVVITVVHACQRCTSNAVQPPWQLSPQKLSHMVPARICMQMLNVNFGLEEEVIANGDLTDDPHRVETTVFELAGPDCPGLLADVTQLLTTNDCDVRSAAVGAGLDRSP